MKFDLNTLRSILDILIVTWLIYRAILLVRGTRAAPMMAGLIAIIFAYFTATTLGLITLAWVLSAFLSSIVLVIVVIFQDEIRKGLTKVGLHPFLRRSEKEASDEIVIDEITLACSKFSKSKVGALIVIQQGVGLDNLVEDATIVDAVVSRKLLIALFQKDSPLHDGAVLIEGKRVKAAGCVLPLTKNPNIDLNLGTRHRAGLGISERSDAIIIIVSEQTGAISVVKDGRLTKNIDPAVLKEMLVKLEA